MRSMASANLRSSSVSPPASWVERVTSTRFQTLVHSGMVVHLLGQQRHAGHEAEGGIEIFEHKGPTDGVTAFDGLPLWQP